MCNDAVNYSVKTAVLYIKYSWNLVCFSWNRQRNDTHTHTHTRSFVVSIKTRFGSVAASVVIGYYFVYVISFCCAIAPSADSASTPRRLRHLDMAPCALPRREGCIKVSSPCCGGYPAPAPRFDENSAGLLYTSKV